MILLQFALGFLMYVVMASASYHEGFKTSPWYFPAVLAASITTTILWFSIAKAESNASKLMITALFWDSMLMLIYLLIPVFFFETKFTTTQGIGVALTLAGLLLTKLG